MRVSPFTPTVPTGRTVWLFAIPVVVFLIFILGQLLILLPAKYLALITRETIETYPTVLYLIIGSFAAVALLAFLGIRFWEKQSLATVGLAFTKEGLFEVMRGYALGLLMGAGVVFAVFIFGGYEVNDTLATRARDLLPIIVLMLAFLLQSFTEEVIFRGWMLARVASRYGLWAGILSNSVLFTLMHIEIGGEWVGGIPTLVLFTTMSFLFSVFLSLLVVRQGSVMGAGAWHAAWNWVFISWFALPTTGIDLGLTPLIAPLRESEDAAPWLTGSISGPEASIMTFVVLGVGTGILLLMRAQKNIDRTRNGPEYKTLV